MLFMRVTGGFSAPDQIHGTMKSNIPRFETGRELWLMLALTALAIVLSALVSPVLGAALLLPFALDAFS